MSCRIGIIGLGFVGSAIKDSMAYMHQDLVLVDTDPTRASGTYEDLKSCEGIFVCVPSPQGEDGKCDTTILESVLDQLKDYEGVIISKTTAPPDVYERLGKEYMNLVHVPEFLTAANAPRDYVNGRFAIVGGNTRAYMNEALRIIEYSQKKLNRAQFCTLKEASLAKYTINTYLATKVIFMNEMYRLAEKTGAKYNAIADMIQMDLRIGNSHLNVPGPDGSFGFGGMCFPKDTAALLKFAEENDVELSVLKAAVDKNKVLRNVE
jgi:UDPglucose 6-dehydrogenase